MATNCKFILESTEFDFIDDQLIDGQLQCNFPHYENGEGCPSCPVYRQLFETRNSHFERMEDIQEQIQKWWT